MIFKFAKFAVGTKEKNYKSSQRSIIRRKYEKKTRMRDLPSGHVHL